MGLAQNLKRMRAAKGLQQSELGDAIGVSEITIRKYEAGERCPKQPGIEALANALGVSAEALCKDVGSTPTEAVQALFDIEEKLGLKPIKVDGMVVLAMPADPETPEQEAFARAMHHWYRNRRDFDEGELTPDEYFAWKDSFKA
ncbi:MAG: helix-turn-helix domain-containing protein [Eggerthellaceae bacterium]|nr:helix-turn-helix domain-containing protein [Eggerthellaceae bacterium]